MLLLFLFIIFSYMKKRLLFSLILFFTACASSQSERNGFIIPGPFSSVRASGEFSVEDGQEQTKDACQFVLYGTDGNVFLKGYQPLIPNYFSFYVNQDEFAYYFPRNQALYKGKSDALTEDDFNIILHPNELKHALLPNSLPSKYVSIERTDPLSGKPERLLFQDKAGHMRSSVSLTNYIKQGEAWYPTHIQFKNYRKRLTIKLKINKLFLNEVLDRDVFVAKVPEGVQVETLNRLND